MNVELLVTLLVAVLLAPLAWAVGSSAAAQVDYRAGWLWARRRQLVCLVPGHRWEDYRVRGLGGGMSSVRSRCGRCKTLGYCRPEEMPARRVVR